MILRRTLASLTLAGLALLAAAPPALAHTELDTSDPAEGASLATAPKQVQLKFAEAVTLPADPVQVTGPGGAKWTVGKATVEGAVVTAPIENAGPAGASVLDYTVLSDDGDEVRGSVHFTLTAAAPSTGQTPERATAPAPAPASAAQTSESGGFPVWAWVVIGVVVIAAIGGVVVARSRRSAG
ncbi:copper resistance CopC family protein [Amycolatopsis pigmentata]|uniref:Copper resistance protein CopC n=1 Tax=Amycolatopsis pigmentata TaxID=450801 RepID=A0ABW5FVV7_9PSEU